MSNVAHNRQNALNNVLRELEHRKTDISAMLPPDLPFDRFYATIHQALRQYPQLLDCDGKSLVNACIKAAYDGLRVDGREAVITVDDVTFGRNTPQERKIKMARYMPMAFGIIQQILRGGEVIAMEVDVIRQNDDYEVRRGTDPGIHHRPFLDGERGSIIAAYSVATLKSGVKTFEVLDRADLMAIRGAASTDKVWKAWEGEMSKKSAARRHRKTLPLGDRDIVIRDSEADELYPDYGNGQDALPAPAQSQRPTRAAIANRQNTEGGQPLDLQDEEEAVIIDGDAGRKPAEKKARAKPQPKKDGPTGEVDIPEDEDAWRAWAVDVEDKVVAAADADAVNAIAKAEEGRLAAASKERSDYLRGLITDRLADFVTGEGQG